MSDSASGCFGNWVFVSERPVVKSQRSGERKTVKSLDGKRQWQREASIKYRTHRDRPGIGYKKGAGSKTLWNIYAIT